MDENTSPPYKHTKCQGCMEISRPLFMRSPPRHAEDTWCSPCMDAGKHT